MRIQTLNSLYIFCLLILLAGCSLTTPDIPPSDNPFDPDNPETSGDPFKLAAGLDGDGVHLVWRVVKWQPLTGYAVYRRTDDSLFARIQQLLPADTTFLDRTIFNGHSFEYYIAALSARDESSPSNCAKAAVHTNPVLFIEGETVAETPTRNITVMLIAFEAESMLLSNEPDFAGAVWEPFAPTKSWQLTTGEGTKRVYGRVAFAGDTSGVVMDEIEPAGLNPSLQILPDSLYINHTDVTLSMPNVGATEMKITNNPGTEADWQPYQPEINWNLSSGDGWKKVYGWFRNDFFPPVGPLVDSVGLDTKAEIEYCDWVSDGGDSLVPGDQVFFTIQTSNDAFGAEVNGHASIAVNGWTRIALTGGNDGRYESVYTITEETPKVINTNVIAWFTDRSGNEARTRSAEHRLTAYWTPGPGDEHDFPLGNTGQTVTMCWIPAGSFQMGRQLEEENSESDEDPRHQVTFAQGFWMGKYEVTQSQWRAVMGSVPSYFQGDDLPVEQVSWDDIQQFEDSLSGAFRLPSESEWEYACRAETTTRFYWGDDSSYIRIGDYAWYGGNSGERTHSVGGKTSNTWGLSDMNGNVLEWCEDWYHNTYMGAPVDGGAWIVDGGDYRVIRGGGIINGGQYCRSSSRFAVHGERGGTLGFRLVRDAD